MASYQDTPESTVKSETIIDAFVGEDRSLSNQINPFFAMGEVIIPSTPIIEPSDEVDYQEGR